MNVGSTKELSPEKRISITPDTSKGFKKSWAKCSNRKRIWRKPRL